MDGCQRAGFPQGPGPRRYGMSMVVYEVRHRYPDDMGERYDAIIRQYPEVEWDHWRTGRYHTEDGIPHCDQRVLHAPGECAVCDLYPQRQIARVNEQVAFSGHKPRPGQTPCPADEARPPGTPAWHGRWGGNVAHNATPAELLELDEPPIRTTVWQRLRRRVRGILR